jgi:ABC-2 type transport system ATP-binding protein
MVSGGESSGYGLLTVRENLWMFAQFYGISTKEANDRIKKLLEIVGLSDRANMRSADLSTGLRQKMNIVRGFLTDPEILFLDEPTSGLDPEAAAQVRELIADVRQKEGTTVLICTHNLDEAQRLCDRLLIMRQGSTLAIGTLSELRKLVSPGMWLEVQLLSPFEKMDQIRAIAGVLSLDVHSLQEVKIEVESEAAIPQVVSGLVALGALILRLQPQEIPLEQVYLQLQNSNHKSNNGHNGGTK